MRSIIVGKLLAHLLSPPATTRQAAVDRMERTSAVTHLMASLEHLANRHERRRGGMNDWSVTAESCAISSPIGRRLVNGVANQAVTNGTHVARVGAAAALLLPVTPRWLRISANALLAGSSLALHPRHHYGTDGSDQVSFLVQSASLLARAAGSRTRLVDSVLWTVALQSTLSYAISGWAKIAGRTWREGRALPGVTRTLTYGDERTFRFTRRFPRSAKVLGASVLALECTFPLAYLAGGRLAKSYVIGTTTFHLGVARIMALGRFVPSFVSMHGPVEYTARARAATAADGVRRDDTMVGMVGLAMCIVVGSAGILRRRNRRLTLAGRGDEHRFISSQGNDLAYRCLTHRDSSTPIFVFESGMLATAEHWEWVTNFLQQQGTVVTYSRAGYGGSKFVQPHELTISTMVGDLVELADHVAGTRPVILVGHSLGGYLAMRATQHRPVDAVILVDSSHPDELTRSKRQELGAEALTDGIGLTLYSMEAGAALLVDRPDWVDSMPTAAHRTMFAQFRDARMWRAARREWVAVRRHFEGAPGIPPTTVPVLSISAGRTVSEDPIQGQLHREMAEASSDGRHEVIDHADHDSVLTSAQPAQQVARLIAEFVSERRSSEESAA